MRVPRLKIALIFPLFLFAYPLPAQEDNRVDSLQQLLEQSREDTVHVNILNHLAIELRRTDVDLAVQYAKEAKALSEDLDYQKGVAKSFYSLARIDHSNYRLSDAREKYVSALDIYEDLGMKYEMGDVLNKMGITYGMEGIYDESLDYFNRSLEIRIELGSKPGIAECTNNLGNVYRYKGDYEMSVESYSRFLSLSEEMGDLEGIGDAYNHIGIVYDYQGNYNMALEYYFKSLEIREKIDDKLEVGGSYSNIGIVYSYLGDFDKALEYHLKFLTISKESDDKQSIGIACNNIGTVYEGQEKLELALEYYQKGLEIRKEIEDTRGVSYGYYNIGNVLFKQEKYDEALEYQERSMAIREEMGYIQGIAYNQMSLSRIFKAKSDHAKAIRFAENALKTGEEIGYAEIIKQASEILHTEYSASGDFRKAYKNLDLFKEMSDSLNNAANVKKITQLEMQYDFDKTQEQERVIYEAEMKQQKQLRNFFILGFCLVLIAGFATLRGYFITKRANKEKAVLLKEIHHRVKNNLQVISSLLNLQSHSLEDTEIKEAVKEGQSRVKSMALIHQSLYQSDRLSKIEFQEYLEQLLSFLGSIYKDENKQINCSVSAQNINLDIDTAIPLGLIINEMVSNAYKYAFKGRDHGEIKLVLEKLKNDTFRLEVSDNGIGLPSEIETDKADSLGLKLVNILTRQLKGELKIERKTGTQFILEFSEVIRKG